MEKLGDKEFSLRDVTRRLRNLLLMDYMLGWRKVSDEYDDFWSLNVLSFISIGCKYVRIA